MVRMRTRVFLIALAFGCAVSPRAQTSGSGQVAPGIVLPTNGDATVFALDQTPAGPALVHIDPHEVVIASHAATNFLRAQILSGPHQSAEVDGPHAATMLASANAVFFVRLFGEDAELMRSRVHLLWLQPGKKRREITDFSMNVWGGQRARNVDEVPCDAAMVEGTNWLRITPKQPLLPGEFAIVFLPKDVNQQPSTAYDFSVPGDDASQNNPYAGKPPMSADAKK
jgi:hypothetical protein